jgi:hypothetical protein
MVRLSVAGLCLLAVSSPGCGSRVRHTSADLTEGWRGTIEYEVYPRAERELGCPRTSLDFTCLDDHCRSVRVWGCGRTIAYVFDRSRTWVRVDSTR